MKDQGQGDEGMHEHEQVHGEGEMHDQVHSVGERQEHAQVEGEMHVQAQSVDGSRVQAKERRRNYGNKQQVGNKAKKKMMETVGVMFVDQTVLEELAKEMQKAEDIIAEMVGY